jgi:hypothetical protein
VLALPSPALLSWHHAYQVAFEAIKQLAVLLRNALQQKTKDSFKEVYCWQVGPPNIRTHQGHR